MPQADFDRAREHALERMARELSPLLVYHSLAHTRDDVVPAAERLAALEGVDGEDLLLLRTAAYYHDIGFVERREDHESAGIRIIREVLPGFGYSSEQVETVCDLVATTRLPQTPHNLVEQILADADLDMLGREDYWIRNEDLRREWRSFGLQLTDEEWYRNQLDFLSNHRYFTRAAHELRDATKQANIDRLLALLGDHR